MNMQNSAFPWVASSLGGSQKWPGYQASITDLFLKKANPSLHPFSSGISQLAAASSYLEKMAFSSSNCSGGSDVLSHSYSVQPRNYDKEKAYSYDLYPQYVYSLKDKDEKGPQPTLSRRSSSESPSSPNNDRNKQFLCTVCHRCFTQKGNLKTHMLIHTGEKPYHCQICGKSFTQKGNVDTHMKIHTGERDYGCDSCGKRFTQKGNLKTHVRSVHTKEKPYVCGMCGKSFSQKGNMQTHLRTHNKDDRFPCNLCDKTFSQKGNLKTHMQRHTGQLQARLYSKKSLMALKQSSLHFSGFGLSESEERLKIDDLPSSSIAVTNNTTNNTSTRQSVNQLANSSPSNINSHDDLESPKASSSSSSSSLAKTTQTLSLSDRNENLENIRSPISTVNNPMFNGCNRSFYSNSTSVPTTPLMAHSSSWLCGSPMINNKSLANTFENFNLSHSVGHSNFSLGSQQNTPSKLSLTNTSLTDSNDKVIQSLHHSHCVNNTSSDNFSPTDYSHLLQ